MPKFNKNKDKFMFRRKIYVLIIAILLIIICVQNPKIYTILPSILLFIFICIYSIYTRKKGREELSDKLNRLNLDLDRAAQSTIVNFPFPLVIIEKNGNIVWKSSKFISEFENVEEINDYIGEIEKQINTKIEEDSEEQVKDRVEFAGKTYRVIGEHTKTKGDDKEDFIETIYFIDETSKVNLLRKYADSKICVGIVMIDNYEELMQRIDTEDRVQLISQIEKKLYAWASRYEGVAIKSERDTFVCIFEQKMLEVLKESKFDILDEIKEVETEDKLQATLSIALNFDGETNLDKYFASREVIDIALGRGGDQAIIKQDDKYTFFGGRTPEVEKRTKVKARIVSTALEELIKNSSNVFIMGHTNPDIDAMGASIGIYRLAKANDKDAYIINNLESTTLDNFIEDLKDIDDYKGVVIDKLEALAKVNKDTLLVVVDTYRKGYVEVPELLDETDNIVVIDHHRKTPDYIENAILTYHEVYASSTCELVTELIEYSKQEVNLSQFEAESLFAGIMMDTKNFTYKTGVRTFEAAAYLRKCGVDLIKVKKWFQSGLEAFRKISTIIANAEIINDNIAISIYEENESDSNITSAKAADELLTINNITASFVICEQGDKVYISGRSIGDINVQIILEKLGGGGHITMAGAQLSGMTVEEVRDELIIRINEYFTEEIN